MVKTEVTESLENHQWQPALQCSPLLIVLQYAGLWIKQFITPWYRGICIICIVKTHNGASCFLMVFVSSVHTSVLQTLLLCILSRYGIAPAAHLPSHLSALSSNAYLGCALKALWFICLTIVITRKIDATSTVANGSLLQYAVSYNLVRSSTLCCYVNVYFFLFKVDLPGRKVCIFWGQKSYIIFNFSGIFLLMLLSLKMECYHLTCLWQWDRNQVQTVALKTSWCILLPLYSFFLDPSYHKWGRTTGACAHLEYRCEPVCAYSQGEHGVQGWSLFFHLT